MQSHYLNQCWVIVNWTLKKKLQWNFNRNIKFFIHENASENIWEIAAILSRGRWVNWRSVFFLIYKWVAAYVLGIWCPGKFISQQQGQGESAYSLLQWSLYITWSIVTQHVEWQWPLHDINQTVKKATPYLTLVGGLWCLLWLFWRKTIIGLWCLSWLFWRKTIIL